MVGRSRRRGAAKWAAVQAKAGHSAADEAEDDLGPPPSPGDSSYYQDQVDDFHEARSRAALAKGWSEVPSGDEDDGDEEEEVLALDIDEDDGEGESSSDEEGGDDDDEDDDGGSSVQSEGRPLWIPACLGVRGRNFTMTRTMVPSPEADRASRKWRRKKRGGGGGTSHSAAPNPSPARGRFWGRLGGGLCETSASDRRGRDTGHEGSG